VSDANVDVVRRIEEAWAANDLDALDDLIAADYTPHTPGSDQLPPGLAGAKLAHQQSLQGFPDRENEILEIFGEGDLVVCHAKMTGTNTGGLPWFGIGPNGRRVDTDWITIYRLQDGKAVETWAQMDLPRMMMQLGVMPGMGGE
jgi:predicted ester cyclase